MQRALLAILLAAACGGLPASDGPGDSDALDAPDAPDGLPQMPPGAPPLPISPPVRLLVTDLEPQMGPAAGGTAVTLRGGGFAASAIGVRLGGTELAGVTAASVVELGGTTSAGAGFSDAIVRLGAATAILPRAYYHGAWTTVGPSGGAVRDLATAGPTDVYAATGGAGVFRSTDRGASWVPASAGLTSKVVDGLAVDPTDPAHVFAATRDGIFVTTDAGASWAKAGNGPTFTQAVAVAPGQPQRVLALSGSRVYRSTDGGATWVQVLAGLSGPVDIAIAATDPALVLVATSSGLAGGAVRSTDGGTTWSAASAGLTTPYVEAVAFDPRNGQIAYAAAQYQVFKSMDGGASWARTSFSFQTAAKRVVVDAAGTVYVGAFDARLMTSADEGATWTEISTGIGGAVSATEDINCIAVGAAPGDVLAGVGSWGVYRTTTGGASWSKSDAGLQAADIPFVAASPTTPGRAFAVGVGGELWRTTDHGATWHYAWNFSGFFARPRSVGFHPSQPNLVLAGADGMYRSTDGGVTWAAVNQGILGATVTRILFDPDQPSRVYAASQQGLYRSVDTGQTWQRVFTNPNTSSSVDGVVKRGAAVLAAATRLYRSLDDGQTWAAFGAGLPAPVTELQVDPGAPAGVYALAGEGVVYRSADGGATWAAVTAPSLRVRAFAIDPTRPATIYLVSDQGAAVLRSVTGLATVVPFDAGLPAGAGRTIAVDRGGGAVYLGTAFGGLSRLGG